MQLAVLAATMLLAAAMISTAHGYMRYQSEIPNGDRVPNPCQEGSIWNGVGHQSPAGSNARNPFGLDFQAAGHKWTNELCRKDSDNDGLTNGQELGDPDCVWTKGATPAKTTGLSHPGICPTGSTRCTNSFTVCPKVFNCPALNGPNITVRNFTIPKNTPVPAKETTYMCQAFELNNTADAVHMIGSRPIIVNADIMHHMIIYSCSVRPEQALFDGPQECFMGKPNCLEVVNLWAYGIEGECFNSDAGFRVGGGGYRYGLLELHWNNPSLKSGLTDSSGFSIYFTTTEGRRKYDQGTVMYGEVNLVIPPRMPLVSFNHTCPSVCTTRYHAETRYITATMIHMHTYGIKGRVSLWRNGTLVKDLSPLQVYDYNSPQMITFDPPIEYHVGDEVKTECYFNTQRANNTVFFGDGTSDEMCLSFLTYYPNNVSLSANDRLATCLAASGINYCYLRSRVTPHIEGGCNITGMLNGDIPKQVVTDMYINGCYKESGCVPTCRNYLNNILYPSNACYDPKRSRAMAELLGTGISKMPSPNNLTIASTLFGQRFCDAETARLAALDSPSSTAAPTIAATPAATVTSGLTSEHLLIIIIVCSCLGFVLVLAVLGVIAIKLQGGSGKARGHGAPMNGGSTYKVYDADVIKS